MTSTIFASEAPNKRHDKDREKELRNDLEPFGDAHERFVELAAGESRERADHDAENRGHRRSGDADQQRDRARRWRRGRACRDPGRRSRTDTLVRAGRTCAHPSPRANQ
jgi:hypothetical protein